MAPLRCKCHGSLVAGWRVGLTPQSHIHIKQRGVSQHWYYRLLQSGHHWVCSTSYEEGIYIYVCITEYRTGYQSLKHHWVCSTVYRSYWPHISYVLYMIIIIREKYTQPHKFTSVQQNHHPFVTTLNPCHHTSHLMQSRIGISNCNRMHVPRLNEQQHPRVLSPILAFKRTLNPCCHTNNGLMQSRTGISNCNRSCESHKNARTSFEWATAPSGP